jgi:hypothetical protein
MWLFAVILAVLVALQIWLLTTLNPSALVGDEKDYLHRGSRPDPHKPTVYLRVPLFPELSRWINILFCNPERAWRWINILFSTASAGIVLWTAYTVGGETTLLISGLCLLLLIERQLLAQHIWPDTLLSLFNAILLLLLITYPPTVSIALIIGVVLMLSVMTRIEQLVLLPAVVVVLTLKLGCIDYTMSVLVLAPAIASLLLWTLVAKLRYGIAWPDTTWMFNVDLLKGELAAQQAGVHSINPMVAGVHLKWIQMQGNGKTPKTTAIEQMSLLKLLHTLVAKGLSFWGADSFVVGRLLPPSGRAYPDMDARLLRLLKVLLRWTFPLVSLTCFWAVLIAPSIGYYFIPAVFLYLATVSVHFRTRYRLNLIPWLVVAGAVALSNISPADLKIQHWAILLSFYIFGIWLVRNPMRIE